MKSHKERLLKKRRIVMRNVNDWLEHLTVDSVSAIDDMMNDYIISGPLDVPTKIENIFYNISPDDDLRIFLSDGMIKWLKNKKNSKLPENRPSRQNEVRKISEAFFIIYVMDLKNAKHEIINDQEMWQEWTKNLYMSSCRDPYSNLKMILDRH